VEPRCCLIHRIKSDLNEQTTEITNVYEVASPSEACRALLFTLGAAPVFTLGFIGTGRNLYSWVANLVHLPRGIWADELSFPVLAMCFYFSFRTFRTGGVKSPAQKWDSGKLALISVLPILISFVFGRFHPGTPSWWNIFLVPVGEEFLFRGWFYTFFDRLFRGKLFTATNPLPLGVWASALAFSLWHLQNLGIEPWGFVLFQVGYTFLVGIWLGVIRWQTGSLLPVIALHVLLNAVSSLMLQ
jgi:membrane protease YdiL (CAAX protease family)